MSLIKTLEHIFKNLLDFLFVFLLKAGRPFAAPLKVENVEKILCLRHDKLGDMITTIPALHALKMKFPRIVIEVVASRRNAEILIRDPLVDKVHIYKKNILFDWPMIRRLKKEKFDVIFDSLSYDSTTALLLCKLINNNSVLAAGRKLEHRRYYDYCELYQPEGEDHNIDNSFLIFNLFGINPETVDPFQPLFIPEDSIKKAAEFFDQLTDGEKSSIGINISVGSPSRTLSLEKYVNIINSLGDKYPQYKFIIFCTMEHRSSAKNLLSNLKTDGYLIPENLSLLDVSAIMSKLDFLISPDTSLIHIARLMKIPVVGLYSGHRRNFNFWRPYRQEYGAVIAENVDNLFDIEPQQVVEEFDRLFKSVGLLPNEYKKAVREDCDR